MMLVTMCMIACGEYDDDFYNDEDKKTEESDKEINANSEVWITLEKEKYIWHFTFESELDKEFPYSDIEYCVAWGNDENYDGELDYYTYNTSSNGVCKLDVFPVKYRNSYDLSNVLALYEMYFRSYKSLEEKLASGLSLSSSERSLYKDIVDWFDDNTDRYFTTEPFIKIDGKKYELNIDRRY